MAKTVDARGLACPQPVILTRNALRESDLVVTIVDNEIAQRNVTRMAERSGNRVVAEMRDDGTYLRIARDVALQEQPATQAVSTPGAVPLVLVIPSEFIGRGEHPELGQVLARGFLHVLGEVEPVPDTIIFLNSGVKLVAEGSPVLEDLDALCARGVEVLACGTCLQHYELVDHVAVGEVSNMYTIVETILRASKTVCL